MIKFGSHMMSWFIKPLSLCYLPWPLASVDNSDCSIDNSWYHVQPHITIASCMDCWVGVGVVVITGENWTDRIQRWELNPLVIPAYMLYMIC